MGHGLLVTGILWRDGREEAESLWKDTPEIRTNLEFWGPLMKNTSDWLSFFMFTYFTDRDGKIPVGFFVGVGI